MLAHVLATSPLDPLYYAIGWLLALFYKPFNSLGVAIIILTLVVMLAQFPLIAKQTRSMIQMQKIQPELKKIQQKYKDDRAKQTEELQKFYSENHINPLAGCLPLLVIFPIGIAVFRTFSQGVQRHIPQKGPLSTLYNDLCSKATIADGYAKAKAATPPATVKSDLSACSYALDHYPKGQTPSTFRFLGMNLNWSAHEAQSQLAGHWVQWLPYFLLIAIVIFTGWYQVRQTQARQSKQGGAPPNAQMQAITKVMPVFFGFITYGLNAATTIYFVVSNGWRIGQQHFVLNKFYEEEASGKKIKPRVDDVEVEASDEEEPTNGKAPPGKRPGGARPPARKSGGNPQKSTGGSGGGASAGNGSGNRSGANAGAARRKKKRKR